MLHALTMKNVTALDRAFALLTRINAAPNALELCQRAAGVTRARAARTGNRAAYWMSVALDAHFRALLQAGNDDAEMAYQVEKRDRALRLAALRATEL